VGEWNSNGDGGLSVSGTFVWTGGTIGGLGALSVAESATLSIAGTLVKTIGGRPIVNAGRINWSGTGNISFNVGVLTNTLQTSSNLVDWADLITVTNPGPNFIYTLTGPRTLPARFFRARQ
jgi:hypothetical protein